MSTDLLATLGVHRVADFLSTSECERVVSAIRDSQHQPSRVLSADHQDGQVDLHLRRSSVVDVDSDVRALALARISDMRSSLEARFEAELDPAIEAPKFLHYSVGDHFAPHTDGQLGRLINITVGIGHHHHARSAGPTFEAGDAGGILRIYGLVDRPGWEKRGFDVPVEPGDLIAYRSHLVHEVTPVTAGDRYAIVSRFRQRAML